MNNSTFEDRILLITGGTGSFGNAVLRRFLSSGLREIRILSRDEKKQDDMRKRYSNPKIKFYIGDVRDYQSVLNAVRGADFIYHAAALKQVPSCEFHPLEAVKTNVLGTENVLEAAINFGVKRVVCLSTDKAVYPINAMGISKAMMEKVAVAKSRSSNSTVINVTRYGNVMASRGSVIPLFYNQIINNNPITITDPKMTRFLMSLADSVELVFHAFSNAQQGDIFVQKAPAATIETLSKALIEIFNSKSEINIIGTRHGEKKHEALLSKEEFLHTEDLGDFYRIKSDSRDLNYSKYFENGDKNVDKFSDYTSGNTYLLTVEEMKSLLLKLDYIKEMKIVEV